MLRFLLNVALAGAIVCCVVIIGAKLAGVDPTVWLVVAVICVVLGSLLYDPVTKRDERPGTAQDFWKRWMPWW
jgi:hypothetical protein